MSGERIQTISKDKGDEQHPKRGTSICASMQKLGDEKECDILKEQRRPKGL